MRAIPSRTLSSTRNCSRDFAEVRCNGAAGVPVSVCQDAPFTGHERPVCVWRARLNNVCVEGCFIATTPRMLHIVSDRFRLSTGNIERDAGIGSTCQNSEAEFCCAYVHQNSAAPPEMVRHRTLRLQLCRHCGPAFC